MSPQLPSQQKARDGLALIEEAIIEVVRERPGLTGEEIDEALGLPMSAASGGFRGIFGMTLRQGMQALEKRNGVGTYAIRKEGGDRCPLGLQDG
jgi:hypothetical protein